MMCAPVAVPPVKVITGIPGCRTIAAPHSAPRPCTTFSTPAGNPASAESSPSAAAVSGVSSLGFATTVHPAANAGAIFQVNKYSGRFHGLMHPATPLGRRITRETACGARKSSSAFHSRTASAKNRRLAAARGMSTLRANDSGFPESVLSNNANRSTSRSTSPASRSSIAARSVAGSAAHAGNARAAAVCATSTSAAPEAAMRPISAPVAGSITGNDSPPTEP